MLDILGVSETTGAGLGAAFLSGCLGTVLSAGLDWHRAGPAGTGGGA